MVSFASEDSQYKTRKEKKNLKIQVDDQANEI